MMFEGPGFVPPPRPPLFFLPPRQREFAALPPPPPPRERFFCNSGYGRHSSIRETAADGNTARGATRTGWSP